MILYVLVQHVGVEVHAKVEDIVIVLLYGFIRV